LNRTLPCAIIPIKRTSIKKLPPLFLLCSLVLAGCGTNQPSAPKTPDTLFFAPDTAEVTGVLRQNQCLSVMEGSRKEMINEAVVIELDRPVAIVSNPESAKVSILALKNIKQIEVANEFDYNFQDLFGKRVTVKGTITRIKEMPGFARSLPDSSDITRKHVDQTVESNFEWRGEIHRQMSTPVEIHVLENR
jgi:hypothetical protein